MKFRGLRTVINVILLIFGVICYIVYATNEDNFSLIFGNIAFIWASCLANDSRIEELEDKVNKLERAMNNK